MKPFILFCLCLVAGMAKAQGNFETLTLKPVKKGEEPKEIIAALKQDFPNGIVTDLNFLSAKLYEERWAAELQNSLDGAVPDFYQVSVKEGNEKYTAVYNKDGKLLSSKTVIKHALMPNEVTQAVSPYYPDWKILNDIEIIKYKSGAVNEVFKVEIQKEDNFRMLFIDTAGNLLKDFSEIPSK